MRRDLRVRAAVFDHFTDEWGGYTSRIGNRYTGHRRIRHGARVYDGDTHTQTIECFFGLAKNGIRGVYNRRKDREPMFTQLLVRAAH